ncbi:serine/threonine-protein kinase fray2 [Phtheirospermum japonicum]|uniref:Serine/threonine-protein kinase fray2 n=1 Tax=Phtheirospermum japonicum TaxID=374723 RepID=A0A830CU56_9LAMI|nr:serine/threonine-protein kinase fray2 [Phtheirospermum japonicum]
MILIDHPNLVRAHCSFTAGHNLWVVMPYMAGGSCLHIMKSAFPEGFEEPVIATLLREVLKALVYLHHHGHIHRDVKAGNILIDSDGAVKLADFGVAACMYDTGDRQRSRNTFVGTPCWMAPEVMQQLHGYDFKADIWSFGITALELAHGHAPFSKYPPMKVLLMTLQNAPPGLDYERDKRFSKSFKEMVAACLVKDPKKRPTSEKLLKHAFFKHARSNEYLDRTILNGLSPLGERFRMLKAKEADMLVQNKASYEDKEQLSQQEYIRGVSAWNFNLEDLKNEAAHIQDDLMSEDSSVSGKHMDGQDETYSEKADHSKAASQLDDELNDLHNLEGSLAVFPMKPLQALKGCFDICEDDVATGSPSSRGSVQSDSEQQSQHHSTANAVDREASGSLLHSVLSGRKKLSSGSLVQDTNNALSPKKFIGDGDREYLQQRFQTERNHSGPLQYRQKKDFTSSGNAWEDVSEGAFIERRGRFKVTSGELKGPMNFFNPVSGGSSSPIMPNAASFIPSLQFILQQNAAQREELLKLIKLVEQTSANGCPQERKNKINYILLQITPTIRERELQNQVIQLQQSVGSLVEELQRLKAKNSQLERKLNAIIKQDDRIQE